VVVLSGPFFLKGCVCDGTDKLVYAYMGASATEFCNRSGVYIHSSPVPGLLALASSDCSYCSFKGAGCDGYQQIPCDGGAEPAADAAGE
jgi:hypothetical protein